MFSILCAGILAFLLLGALAACQVNAQQKASLPPQLLDVVRIIHPEDIAVAPNGWVYIISDDISSGIHSIVVLEGPKIIGNIPWINLKTENTFTLYTFSKSILVI